MRGIHGAAVWVTKQVPQEQVWLAERIAPVSGHWSRHWEYSWVLTHGDFKAGQWVLDAAGGDAPLQHLIAHLGAQVVNVDSDSQSQPKKAKGVLPCLGDLRELVQVQRDAFDRVACVSVLEHAARPQEILPELWRVLKPGGTLIGSFDVADYARHNHVIDKDVSASLLDYFGLAVPTVPADVLVARFPELQDGHGGKPFVTLNVLCFRVTKESA